MHGSEGGVVRPILGREHGAWLLPYDPQPSPEDRALTVRLVQGGKLLGIEVLDHLIIGDGRPDYFSFADNGLLAGGMT